MLGQDNDTDGLSTAVAQPGDLEDNVTATDTLQPTNFVAVGTQAFGQMKKLLGDVGAVVNAKRLLA